MCPVRDSRPRIVRVWGAGYISPTCEFEAGARVRFVFDGVGGSRILGMVPLPAS